MRTTPPSSRCPIVFLVGAIGLAAFFGPVASDAQVQAMRTYANGIGLAFQIVDDILDVTASSEVLGKTAGKDLLADKTTYPKLLGLEPSRTRALELVREAKAALHPWKDKAQPLLALADYVASRDR